MTISEQIESALREYYSIPEEASVIFYEELDSEGCCNAYSSINLVTSWSWVPEGRKRRREVTRWHYGSLTNFLEENGL
jgi:hypothetical protein